MNQHFLLVSVKAKRFVSAPSVLCRPRCSHSYLDNTRGAWTRAHTHTHTHTFPM